MEDSKTNLKIIGVIPARYSSTRFPGKVLTPICGKPMVQWVHERALKATKLSDLFIATDDEHVKAKVLEFGGKVIMTSSKHASGTDRVAEAVAEIDANVVVNIQGDEPLITPEAIDEVVEPFFNDEQVQMTTLCRLADNIDEIFDPNTVRVVFDQNYNALYFSRSSIPFNREMDKDSWLDDANYYQHIGVYAYKKSFLQKLAKLSQTPLEKIEKLEQLRVLESGYKIRVVETQYSPICVDVPEDVEKVEKLMKTKGLTND